MRRHESFNIVTKLTLNMEKDQETLRLEAEALKTLESKVVDLQEKFHDSIQQTTHGVLEVRDQVVEQAMRFWPSISIFFEGLDPFKATPTGTLMGGSCALTVGTDA